MAAGGKEERGRKQGRKEGSSGGGGRHGGRYYNKTTPYMSEPSRKRNSENPQKKF
jgi:hypothetical protein